MNPLVILSLAKLVFAAPDPCKSGSFFFFPHWWEYLATEKDKYGGCQIDFTFPQDTVQVMLALLDIMLRLAGVIAIIGIIIGSVLYMLALGNPEKLTGARRAITYALVGLAISATATAAVTYVGHALK